MELFRILPARTTRIPVLIHLPHSGTYLPDEIKQRMLPEMAAQQDDCDWHLEQLYDFARDMGIDIMAATHSRWVVDLNRDPNQQPLYQDGRIITGVVPATDFNGRPLYPEGEKPTAGEIELRLTRYFHSYHGELQSVIAHYLAEFGQVLLLDGHSIRALVPGIRSEKFPDFILGTNQHQSAAVPLMESAHMYWQQSGVSYSYNSPFSGGYITRHYGQPNQHVHTLQLEMCKTNYMTDDELDYAPARAERTQGLLKGFIEELISTLSTNEL